MDGTRQGPVRRPHRALAAAVVWTALLGVLVWLMLGGRWAGLFGATVMAVLVLAERRGQPRLEKRRRVRLANVAGPAWVGLCSYCRQPAECWDHVVPFARGGSDAPENLVAACNRCNREKSDRTPEEFWKVIGRRAPYPSYWPRSVKP